MRAKALNQDTRHNLRHLWIKCMFEFASPVLQRKWKAGDLHIIVTFDDCMGDYFETANLGEGLEWAVQSRLFAPSEVEIIADFHGLAEAYNEPSNGDVVRDPNWSKIVDAAQKAWSSLRAVIEAPSEQKLMDELEERRGRISNGPS